MGMQNKEAILDDVGNSRDISIQGTLEFWESKKWVSRVVIAQKFSDLEEPIITVFKTLKHKKNKKGGKTCTLNDFVAVSKDSSIGNRGCTLAIMTLNFDLYFSFERPISQLVWFNWMKQCCPPFKALDMQYLKGPSYYHWLEGKQCTIFMTRTTFMVKSQAIRGFQETILQGYYEEFKFKRREDRVLEIIYLGTEYSWFFCGTAIYEILKIHRSMMKNIIEQKITPNEEVDKYTEGYWLESLPTIALQDPESCGNSIAKSNCSSTNNSLKLNRLKTETRTINNNSLQNILLSKEHPHMSNYIVSDDSISTLRLNQDYLRSMYNKNKNGLFSKKSSKSTTNLNTHNRLDPIYENLQIKDNAENCFKNGEYNKINNIKRLSKSVNNIYINEDLNTISDCQTSNSFLKNHKEIIPSLSLPLGPKPINLNKPLSYYFSPSLSDVNHGDIPGLVKTTGDKKLSFKNIKKTVNKVFRKSITGSFTRYDGDRKSNIFNSYSEAGNQDKYIYANMIDTFGKNDNMTETNNLYHNYPNSNYVDNSSHLLTASYSSKGHNINSTEKVYSDENELAKLNEKKELKNTNKDYIIYVNAQVENI
uniref:IRS-type PTB domain-containing protein n=1 Tax=Parastrongyloides trichosuri TaxID=131310 RepID=A0A0N5A0K6_PARTI